MILLTERHGELDFRLKEKGSSTEVTLRASRLSTPEETAEWRAYVDAIPSRLALSGGPS